MELQLKHLPVIIAALLAGILVGSGFARCSKPQTVPAEPVIVHDTIVRTDSVIIEHTKWRYRTFHDTTIIRVPDTLSTDSSSHVTQDSIPWGDTLTIAIPIDHYEYVDSFGTDTASVHLRVLYSGYRASIDTVGLSYRFEAQPVVVEKSSGWGHFIGLGVSAGYGATEVDRRIYAAPTVAITVTYGWGYYWKPRRTNFVTSRK